MSYEGSPEERQARLFCKQLRTTYDKFSKEKFIGLINILKKFPPLISQSNKQRINKTKRKKMNQKTV